MNIFEQYGIKEVADVCLYSIELDENDDEIYIPVLYLDTLKVSTIEETAEQTSARGGLGNPELIIWDYGKDITVNLEDALYTPASQSMTWSGRYGTKPFILKGEIKFLDKDNQETGENIPINIIVKSFNNFKKIYKSKTNFVIYFWDVIVNIISDDSQLNFMLKKSSISYDTQENKWLFYPQSEIRDDILIGDVDQNGEVNLIDCNKLFNYVFDANENPLSPKGVLAGDVSDTETISKDDRINLINSEAETVNTLIPGINADDPILLQNYIIGMIDKGDLDEKKYIYSINEQNPVPPQEAIYQIEHGLQNVHFLDRMEKCVANQTFCIDTVANTCHGNYRYLQQYSQCELAVFIDPRTMQPYEPNTDSFTRKNGESITGELRIIKKDEIYYKWTRSKAIDNTSLGYQIIVDAIHFPGTYRLVGETYSRSRKTGKDQRYQFEIPLCKMGTENNLTLQADGDPTTFNLTLKVLRREDGVMMKLTQFDVTPAKYDGYTSDSTVIVSSDEIVSEYSAEIE